MEILNTTESVDPTHIYERPIARISQALLEALGWIYQGIKHTEVP